MSQIIQNIVAVLSSYANGKLFVRKEKRGKKSVLKDVVCISDEARKRLLSGREDEGATAHIDETYKKSSRQGD
jgi:hypothetical protein